MFFPIHLLIDHLLGTDTDNLADISTLSSRGMHEKVLGFEGDGVLDLEFVIRIVGSDIE